jgi:hypothetical protein
MSPELLKKILAVKESGDGNAALELLTEIVVEYAAGEQPAGDPTAGAADPPPDPEAEAMTALGREVVTLCGASSAGEAVTRAKAVFAEHAEIEARAVKLEASERRGLVADLVTLGAETPATAWARNEAGEIGEGDARVACKRLTSEPIAELRARVAALRAANPRAARRITPPETGTEISEGDRVVKTPRGEVTLSAREIKNCEEKGVKVETYAENKAIRESARRGRK